jgi:hypothetical protein
MTSKDERYRNAFNPKLNLTPLNALPLSGCIAWYATKNDDDEVMR